MMSSPLRLTSVLLIAALAAGCSVGDFYDREYVLYDSTTPPAQGSPERAEQDRIAADAESPGAVPDDQAPAAERIERIFVLENLRDELDRALTDGVGDAEALRRKRDDVQREIAWRKEELGEAYDAARLQRLERLRGFPVVVR